MSDESQPKMPWWSWISPLLGAATLTGVMLMPQLDGVKAAVVGIILIVTVFAAVYHAEVIAHRVGEPFGTLVLAIAVTVIEGALILSLMIEGGASSSALVRDTMFAAVMIVCNGIIGLSLLLGGVRHHVQTFQLQGALSALAVLAALTTLTLIVPNVTSSAPGNALTSGQLIFAGAVSLVLYGAYVFVQTISHRDFFLPPTSAQDDDSHADAPSKAMALASLGLLVVALVSVVGLAKALSPLIERGVQSAGAPKAVVGIIIAALVLMPEALAALRAARLNRLQTSMNLALGSALATIGLTMPAVAVVSIAIGQPLELGLGPKEVVLLALTLFLNVITLGTGRTTVLQGVVHLCIFASFLFFAVVP